MEDFFTDENASKQKIGETLLDGQTAYDVIMIGYGAHYAVMIECNNGIYEISFERNFAGFVNQLGGIERKILSTFKFIE